MAKCLARLDLACEFKNFFGPCLKPTTVLAAWYIIPAALESLLAMVVAEVLALAFLA